jgi:hypothetical protein
MLYWTFRAPSVCRFDVLEKRLGISFCGYFIEMLNDQLKLQKDDEDFYPIIWK